MGSANGFAPIGGSDGVVSLNRILARLSPEEFALSGRREERSGRNVVLVACLSPHPGRPNGRASRFPGPARRSLVVRDAVLDHLGRLAQIMTDHPAQSLWSTQCRTLSSSTGLPTG